MKYKFYLKSVFEVIVSNGISIVAGILAGFVLPSIVSVEDYGYIKTFSLYVSYIGLFSIGILDGISIKYGNCDYKDLNKSIMSSILRALLLILVSFSSILLIVSVLFIPETYKFIFILVSLDLVFTNTLGFYQHVSQITMRFKEYSSRSVFKSILNVVLVALLLLVSKSNVQINYQYYIVGLVAINVLLSLWYSYTYRDMVFYKDFKKYDIKKEIYSLIKLGFPLMLANLCSTLLLVVDRQYVNLLFDNSTYAIYAFAYNLLSLITIATSAIATVIYPILRRADDRLLRIVYGDMCIVLSSSVFILLVLFWPVSALIHSILPQYVNSLPIFRIVFPGLAIDSVITVIIHNYYKTFKLTIKYFIISLCILGVSALFNLFAYLWFGTTLAISIASIVVMMIWFILVDIILRRHLQIRLDLTYYVFIIISILSFYIISALISNPLLAMGIYFVLQMIITTMFNGQNIKRFISMLYGGKKNVKE